MRGAGPANRRKPGSDTGDSRGAKAERHKEPV